MSGMIILDWSVDTWCRRISSLHYRYAYVKALPRRSCNFTLVLFSSTTSLVLLFGRPYRNGLEYHFNEYWYNIQETNACSAYETGFSSGRTFHCEPFLVTLITTSSVCGINISSRGKSRSNVSNTSKIIFNTLSQAANFCLFLLIRWEWLLLRGLLL